MRRFQLILPFRESRRLHGRAYRAQQDGHKEIVGLLLRDISGRLKLEFVENSAPAGSWTLALTAIRDVRSSARENGYQLVGLFHSHPLTSAILGKRDLRSTPLNWLHLVYDVCGREARLWRVIRRRRRRIAIMIPFVVEPRSAKTRRK